MDIPNVRLYMHESSGIYAAVYLGTLYIYCKNSEHWSMLAAHILNTSVKEVRDKLFHSCIYHKLIHSELHQINL